MPQVLDYSSGKPGAVAIKAAGFLGAVRYIGFPSRRKCTTAAELADFTGHGLGMALVYEDSASDWLGGFARGVDAGRRARDHANAIGFPADRPIYMAVDRDVVTEAEFRTMVDYLRGAAGPLGGVRLTGVYGEHDVCARAAQAATATWFWQCRAWSGTPPRLFAGRHLYQRVGQVTVGGITCDINDVVATDWGQHTAQSVAVDPTPPDPEEPEMMMFQSKESGAVLLVTGAASVLITSNAEKDAHVAVGVPLLAVGHDQFRHYETLRANGDLAEPLDVAALGAAVGEALAAALPEGSVDVAAVVAGVRGALAEVKVNVGGTVELAGHLELAES
jgi:hypothetical protein